MVAPVGSLATIGCKLRQARKGATVAADSCAGVWLTGVISICTDKAPSCGYHASLFYRANAAMSYQVLARKWRPRFFDEMVGQEHVLRALINALNEQRLHHAYLFTGTRGVGKTTIARILAKCLNCEQGISARPCGECSACQEIASGRFVDLIEVDAASRTKVEDTRELLDNVQYAPTRGRFKVYLIDEVHMLSTHSFNALLKTLEEPPEHVKFLLATTDPQKLPITVLSRCLQFSLKNMTPESIVGYLEDVLQAEQVGYESPALWQLGRAAQGSMRDALSLTDQAIAFGEGEVTETQVTTMLGTMDRGRLFRLAEIMAIGDAAQVMAEASEMAAHGPDFDEVVQGLMSIWHRASIAQVLPDAIENSQGDRDAILMLARAMNGEDLQLYYQIALSGRQDLAVAPDPRQGFEMLLLRMLAFRPALDVVPDLDVTTALQQSLDEKKKPLTAANAVSAADPAPVPRGLTVDAESVCAVVQTPSESPSVVIDDDALSAPVRPEVPVESASAPSVGSVVDPVTVSPAVSAPPSMAALVMADSEAASSISVAEAMPEPQQAPVAVDENPSDQSALEELAPHTWWQWLEVLPLAGLPLSIARNSALVTVHVPDYHFEVDAQQGALFNDGHRQRIEQALRTRLPDCRITMTLGEPTGETPEQRRRRLDAEASYIAQQSIESDVAVQAIITRFNAVVLPNSIRSFNPQEN